MGGIDHNSNYIKWAQRSLNRLIAAGIQVDGNANNQKYRSEVTNFKTMHGLKEPGLKDSQLGTRCQDLIIRLNTTVIDGGAYVSWLKKVVPGAPQTANGAANEFKQSVRTFQINENSKPGEKLVVDGIVGFKTEFRLIQRSKIDPPGDLRDNTPKPPLDPFVAWLNSMPKEKRYGFMMEIAAKRYAEGNYDPNIKELAQRLRAHPIYGIPGQYFFTSQKVRYLVYGDKSVKTEKDPRTKLQTKLIKGLAPWSYGYYDLNDPSVQEIVQKHYMESAAVRFYPYYAYPFASKAHYEFQFQKFFDEILDVHHKIESGIGQIQYLKNKEHGDPNARLAHNLVRGLSKTFNHLYGAYQNKMPANWWEYESPFPVDRKW